MLFSRLYQRNNGFRHNETDILLHSFKQAPATRLNRVLPRAIRRDVDFTLFFSYRQYGDIIGEEIERAATPSVKTGVVPMAGKHAVIDGSPMEGETHMGTPVVHGIENPLVIKNGDGHRPLDYEASLLA